jgi:hypothetical protein
MSSFRTALLCGALLAPSLAQAAPFTVVDVGAPAINCVFNVTCTITVNDTVGNFSLPLDSGTGRLQSRNFVGAAPAAAAGLNGYDYRVDMTSMNGITAKNCVSAMQIDFGPVATENYKPATPSQLFVVTSGGLGSVGVVAANLVGDVLTVRFDKGGVCPGQTSYFFGLAAKGTPMPTIAKLVPTISGPAVAVDARSPKH